MSALDLYIPLAHAAHWYLVPLYAAPALVVLGGAIRTAIKERRKGNTTPRGTKRGG